MELLKAHEVVEKFKDGKPFYILSHNIERRSIRKPKNIYLLYAKDEFGDEDWIGFDVKTNFVDQYFNNDDSYYLCSYDHDTILNYFKKFKTEYLESEIESLKSKLNSYTNYLDHVKNLEEL